MRQTIADAIRHLHRMTVDYAPGLRTIEPHAIGYSKDGNVVLRAYQIDGASASGEHEHWKLFRLDRMRSAVHLADTFTGPRPGYKRDDSAMKGGIIQQL